MHDIIMHGYFGCLVKYTSCEDPNNTSDLVGCNYEVPALPKASEITTLKCGTLRDLVPFVQF